MAPPTLRCLNRLRLEAELPRRGWRAQRVVQNPLVHVAGANVLNEASATRKQTQTTTAQTASLALATTMTTTTTKTTITTTTMTTTIHLQQRLPLNVARLVDTLRSKPASATAASVEVHDGRQTREPLLLDHPRRRKKWQTTLKKTTPTSKKTVRVTLLKSRVTWQPKAGRRVAPERHKQVLLRQRRRLKLRQRQQTQTQKQKQKRKRKQTKTLPPPTIRRNGGQCLLEHRVLAGKGEEAVDL